MARDLIDEGVYYATKGGVVPVKWTAPEVGVDDIIMKVWSIWHSSRLSCTISTPLPVMCTALGWCCMRYGVWGPNLTRT